MIGSWRWNAIAGASAFALIFLLSYGNNPLPTTTYRAGVSLAVVFAVTYAVRWLLGQAVKGTAAEDPQEDGATDEEAEAGKGQSVDLMTPDDADFAGKSSQQFTPLVPPRLSTKGQQLDPEQLARAVRHMSEQ